MRDFASNRSHERGRDGKSGGNPTVGIDDMDRNIVIIDALNRIADILQWKMLCYKNVKKNCCKKTKLKTISYLSCRH